MNIDTGEIVENPGKDEIKEKKLIPIAPETADKLGSLAPQERVARLAEMGEELDEEAYALLFGVSKEEAKEIAKRIEQVLLAKDKLIGIPEDAPDELRIAMRNMGPTSKKMFLKKLKRDKKFRKGKNRTEITELEYRTVIDRFS